MNLRSLILLSVVCSAVTFSGCSACSPAPVANNSSANSANTPNASAPTTGTPGGNGPRLDSRAVPQGTADPTAQMEGIDAGPIRINFKQGENTSTVTGKVENTGRVDHVVSASNGQTMTVTITSTDNNATFWLQHHKGKEITGAKPADNARKWSGKLDMSGDYYVIVKGAKGAAEYQLTVTIK